MAAYCSAAERCPFDVERKLLAAELSAEATRRILSRLTEQNYLDEARFALSFAGDKLKFNSWGPIRIAHELRQKRISAEQIVNALAALGEESCNDVLRQLLQSKIKTLRGDNSRENRFKLIRFASGRGFEYDRINQCLARLLKNYEDTDDYMD